MQIRTHSLTNLLLPALWGLFGISRSVRLFVPWCSCLGYRHVGCLQLSHHWPPEMCRLWTHPRMDVDVPLFLNLWIYADALIVSKTICHHRTDIVAGLILSPPRRDTLFCEGFGLIVMFVYVNRFMLMKMILAAAVMSWVRQLAMPAAALPAESLVSLNSCHVGAVCNRSQLVYIQQL